MIRHSLAGGFAIVAVIGLAVFGFASPAGAHHCGSLADCLPSGRSLLLALAAVLVIVGLVILFSAFPPAGALALAGGGIAGSAGAISLSTAAAGTATVGAGIALAAAAEGMPTGGGTGSSGSSGRGGDPARPDNTRRFPEDNFEGTEYSADELASMVHRHTGSGQMHIGGSAPRPTEAEVLHTLRFGRYSELEGQNAVQYVRDGIRVIINRDMPWQSTSYYIGG